MNWISGPVGNQPLLKKKKEVMPVEFRTRLKKPTRNAEIIARYEAGETGASIAQAFGVSEQRVNQIVQGKRK